MGNNYWQKRIEREESQIFKNNLHKIAEQKQLYLRAKKEIESQIDKLFLKFKENSGLSIAREELSKLELSEFRWNLKRYLREIEKINPGSKLLKKIKNAGLKHRIDRLTALETSIDAVLHILAKEKENLLSNHLAKTYEDTYYATNYYKYLSEKTNAKYIQLLDVDGIQKAIRKSWASDGSNFSERIWKNRDK